MAPHLQNVPWLCAALFVHATGAPLLDKPAMRLYGIVSPHTGWGPDRGSTLTDEDLLVASQMEMIYPGKFDDATMAKLKGKSVRIKYKNYGGSSPVEVADTEIQHHADVAYYKVGVLQRPVSTASAEVHVMRMPHKPHTPDLPWNASHPGGLKASTAKGNSTVVNKQGVVQEYITWLRIGQEYMKITAVRIGQFAAEGDPSVPPAVATVERGLWGSPIQVHDANASVFAPIYHANGCYPDGSGKIRYAWDPSKAWTAQWVAAAYDSPDTLDGLWMDCFGKRPFRALNAYGVNIGTWMHNLEKDELFRTDGYVAAQKTLVKRVRALTKQHGATHLYANNVDDWENAPVLLKPGALLDGGALEAFIGNGDGPCGFVGNWSIKDEQRWRKSMIQVLNASQQGLPIMPMTGSAGCESPQLVSSPNREAIEDFAYASFLLAAGTKDALFGIVPYIFRNNTSGQDGGLQLRLHERYFLPIGVPKQTFTADELDRYLIGSCTFARRFTQALVLVNPSSTCTDKAIQLDGTWYDPTSGKALTSVTMLPQQSHILVQEKLNRSLFV